MLANSMNPTTSTLESYVPEARVTGTAISLFTGGMGLDLGFELEGFQTQVAVESEPAAVETIHANRPNLRVLMGSNGRSKRPARIEDVSIEELLTAAGLAVGEATVLIGAPPCEPYTTVGSRNGKEDHRADGIEQFIRVINEAQPRFFVLEEVSSFLSAAVRHISFYDRVATRQAELPSDVRLGSFFDEVMAKFRDTGYELSFEAEHPRRSVLNAVDYGAAQNRKRFILIGSRDGARISLPAPTHTVHKTLGEVLDEVDDPCPEHHPFPRKWGSYLRLVPEGGCWRNLSEDIQREVMGGAIDDPDDARTRGKKGGRTGFLRRLSRDKPAPTLVDSPTTKAACLCHPNGERPLSIKEYAALQGFPPDWKFEGSRTARYRLIGQATPVPLARAVAQVVRRRIETELRERDAGGE